MITKRKSTHAGQVLVRFELPAYLWAAQIHIAGDFNNWDEHALPMQQDRNGVWSASIELPEGQTFEFRYLVDDHWLTDNYADGTAINSFGTQNSLLRTKLPVERLVHAPDIVHS